MKKCEHEFEPLGKGWKCKKCGWLAVELPKPKRKVSTAKKKAE